MSETIKDQIFRLRNAGLTFMEIHKEVGCSKATVSYHLSDGQKEKTRARNRKIRNSDPLRKKIDTFKRNARGRKSLDNRTQSFQARGILDVKDAYDRRKHTFTYKDVVAKFENTTECALSGILIFWHSPSTYAFDHEIPASRGGDNSLENLQILDNSINKMKGNMLDEEFIELCRLVHFHNLENDDSEEHF